MKAVAWSVELGDPRGSSADTLFLTHTLGLAYTHFSLAPGVPDLICP